MSYFKKKLAAFSAILALLAVSGPAMAYLDGQATVVGSANANFVESTDKTRLDVNVNSINKNLNGENNGKVAQVDWGVLGNKTGQTINFGFSGLSQTIINRVIGGSKSQFYGMLTNGCAGGGTCTSYADTGKVVIINPNGVLFGAGSQVDINSLTVSTHDFTGARNINSMTAAQQQAYLEGLQNSATKNDANSTLDYDYNRYLNFSSLGNGKTEIELNGATFNYFAGGANLNKSLNLISDNIKYTDSQIRVGSNGNYNSNSSYGRVNLITADGVNFTYLLNGYGDTYTASTNAGSTVAKNISINNSGLLAANATTEAIRSGNVRIHNTSSVQNDADGKSSNINISNTIIKANKLVANERGEIYIRGGNDVNISDSRLETVNISSGGVALTKSLNGGEIYVRGGSNVKIEDSLLYTAGTDNSTDYPEAGRIRIYADDQYVKILDDSRIISKGDIDITSSRYIQVDDSLIQASKHLDTNGRNDINLEAPLSISVTDSSLQAVRGDIMLNGTDANSATKANITIQKNNKNTILSAENGHLSIIGNNTTINNAVLRQDQGLHFYNDGTAPVNTFSGLNNLTLQNDIYLAKSEGGELATDYTLKTNGNILMDKADIKRAEYHINMTRNASNAIIDDKTVDGITYTTSVTPYRISNLEVDSTSGNITAQNKSNAEAFYTVKFNAETGNIIVDDSTIQNGNYVGVGDIDLLAANNVTIKNGSVITSYDDINATAAGGSLKILNSGKTIATQNVNLTANNNITFGAKGDTVVNPDIDNSATIKSLAANVNIKSKTGNITGEKTTMPTIEYAQRLTFDAQNGKNKFTSANSLKSVNVDYIANENEFITADDIQFSNSKLKAHTNEITTTNNGGDVILNNLTVLIPTDENGNALYTADKVTTTIIAKGDITTQDVTGTYDSDVTAVGVLHKFPVGVNYVATEDIGETTLNLNNTKLIASTSATPTAENPALGSITLRLANASNAAAGIELTAENNGGWDVAASKAKGETDSDKYNGYKTMADGSKISYGPVVNLSSASSTDTIAVSKIITDKLNIIPGTKIKSASVDLTGYDLSKFTADKTTLTNTSISLAEGETKGYIVIRDQGGFNQDAPDSNGIFYTPTAFSYVYNFNESEPDATGKIWSDHHYITYPGTDPSTDFMLVYNRPVSTCPAPPVITDKSDETINEFEAANDTLRTIEDIRPVKKEAPAAASTGVTSFSLKKGATATAITESQGALTVTGVSAAPVATLNVTLAPADNKDKK